MLPRFYHLSLVLTMGFLYAQTSAQNLIPNPGFENLSTCPSWIMQMPNAVGWVTPNGHGGSPDLLHTCATDTVVSVPANVFGSQTPHNGNGYLGLTLFHSTQGNFREYAVTQLSAPLLPGTTYEISAWVSCADNCLLGTDALQFLVSNARPSVNSGWGPMSNRNPQAAVHSGNFLLDKTNWVQVSDTFVAAGGEEFLTIGNFRPDNNTSVLSAGPGSYMTSYIYIDDVELQEVIILGADLMPLAAHSVEDGIRLDWATLSEQNTDYFEVLRSLDGTESWEQIGEEKAAGDSGEKLTYRFTDRHTLPGLQHHYRVRLVDQDGATQFSNIVSALPMNGKTIASRAYPNPTSSGGQISLDLYLEKENAVKVELTDLRGKQLMEKSVAGKAGENVVVLPLEAVAPGTYILHSQIAAASTVDRIVVQ